MNFVGARSGEVKEVGECRRRRVGRRLGVVVEVEVDRGGMGKGAARAAGADAQTISFA